MPRKQPMPTQVDALAIFKREVKNLARKYPAVINVVNLFISELETGSHPGVRVRSLRKVVYKERLPNPSAGRGKSGGFRILADSASCIMSHRKTR